jgi:hypothetical protein
VSILSSFGYDWALGDVEGVHVVLFESPMDALAWYELEGCRRAEKLLLISLCGNPASSFWDNLYRKLSRLKCVKVYLGFDGDEQGEVYVTKALKALEGLEKTFLPEKMELPAGVKDWRDVLLGKSI